jgi:hypothetical protein
VEATVLKSSIELDRARLADKPDYGASGKTESRNRLSYSVRPESFRRMPPIARCGMKLVARVSPMLLLVAATPAWACTLCHSRTADQVRAAVLGSDFISNCAALVAPAPVLAMAAYAVRKYLL